MTPALKVAGRPAKAVRGTGGSVMMGGEATWSKAFELITPPASFEMATE